MFDETHIFAMFIYPIQTSFIVPEARPISHNGKVWIVLDFNFGHP